MKDFFKFCYACYQPITLCICKDINLRYPPEENILRRQSRCLINKDRICIEMFTLDEDKPCEECVIARRYKEGKEKAEVDEI